MRDGQRRSLRQCSRGRRFVVVLSNRSMPPCSVIPELVYEDVGEAVQWLCETFGFVTRWTAGDHRAQARSGTGYADQPDAVEYRALRGAVVTHAIMVRVPDVDAHFSHARERNARILHDPTDYPYGERQYEVEDLGGHRWTFSQTIAEVAPEHWGGMSAVR
jgi:uncharacterized glyoxalase superfamily protein PhnB